MSQLIFNPVPVQNLNGQLKLNVGRLTNIRLQISSERSGTDWRILSRRSIGNRYEQIGSRLIRLQDRFMDMERFIQQAVYQYGDAEEQAVCRSDEIQTVDQLSVIGSLLSDTRDFLKNNKKELKVIGEKLLVFLANISDSDKLLRPFKDLQFYVYTENGTQYLKLAKGDNPINVKMYRNLLEKYLGGSTGKWDPKLVRDLLGKGVFLYGVKNWKGNEKDIGYSNRGTKFKDTAFSGLNNVVDRLKEKQWKVTLNETWSGFKANVGHQDFMGWGKATNLTRMGKGLGLFGSVATVVNNIHESFFSDESKGNSTSNKWKEFAVDTAIDVASTAGSMAVGAAVGSFFLPPVGTVVGAGVGAAVNLAINWPFGDPKMSLVDHTKGLANQAVDGISKGVSNVVDTVKEKASEIVDDLQEGFNKAIGSLGTKLSNVFW